MRFFDADMYYPDAAINVLVRALQANKCSERERFFLSNIGCRRRLERRWQDTPLARALTLTDEWAALKQRVSSIAMCARQQIIRCMPSLCGKQSATFNSRYGRHSRYLMLTTMEC